MLSQTLEDGLSSYGIGERIRALRLKKKIGLVALGQHTGLSAAMLSKIERGRLFPTLPTLLRVALVFGVGLDYFFAGAREQPLVAIVRRRDRVRLPDRPGATPAAFTFESLDFPATERRFNTYVATFVADDAASLEPHDHPGAELVYVMTGALALGVRGGEHVLERGDSVYFDATQPHTYRRVSKSACTAVIVTAP